MRKENAGRIVDRTLRTGMPAGFRHGANVQALGCQSQPSRGTETL
jgi:hypothetical protein